MIDPRSNDQLGIHGIGRKTFLKDVYNIDATKDKPHSNIGFKAPIPLRFKNRIPLYWISDIYRSLFFDTLAEYKFLPESSRIPKHPFFFVTNSGARLTPQQVHVTFTSHCEKIKKLFSFIAGVYTTKSRSSLRTGRDSASGRHGRERGR